MSGAPMMDDPAPARVIAKAGWVHVVDRRLLCVRSHGKAAFYIPGGKPEAGEDLAAALRREIVEELGVRLADPLVPAGEVAAPADGAANAIVTITLFSAPPLGTPAPAGEIAELRWLAAADAGLASAATALVLKQLKDDHVID